MKKTVNQKSKIIIDFLNKLPEPQKTQAIKNAGDAVNKPFVGRTIKDAILSAFILSDSPEGGDYWMDFINDKLL